MADVRLAPTPNAIEREQQSRRIDVGANVEGRDLGSAVSAVEDRIAAVDLPQEYHMEVLGNQRAGRRAEEPAHLRDRGGAGDLVPAAGLLRELAPGDAVFLTAPYGAGGRGARRVARRRYLSLGSLVGFLTVFGIAARNGILMISHFQHLEHEEGEEFGPELVLRGARERLAPILMTAAATGLALVPLAVAGSIPGSRDRAPDGYRHPGGAGHLDAAEPVPFALAVPTVRETGEIRGRRTCRVVVTMGGRT